MSCKSRFISFFIFSNFFLIHILIYGDNNNPPPLAKRGKLPDPKDPEELVLPSPEIEMPENPEDPEELVLPSPGINLLDENQRIINGAMFNAAMQLRVLLSYF